MAVKQSHERVRELINDVATSLDEEIADMLACHIDAIEQERDAARVEVAAAAAREAEAERRGYERGRREYHHHLADAMYPRGGSHG